MARILFNLNCALSGAVVTYAGFTFGMDDYRTGMFAIAAIANILAANLPRKQKKVDNGN